MCFFTCCFVSVRAVLLFRPPRLNSKFEDNVVKYTESVSMSSLRTFIRDNVYAKIQLLQPAQIHFPYLKSCFHVFSFFNLFFAFTPRFGLCPHLTTENRDSLRESDLLTAFYNVDYLRNLKGTNYWRNR